MLARLHDFFVSRFYGTEVYAVYSVGCTEIPVIQIFTQSLAMVALGQFAALEQERDWEGIRRLWRKLLTGSYAVVIPTVVVLLLVARPLIVFMFTGAYAQAIPIFRINTLLKLYLLFNATLVLRAMNRNDISIKVTIVAMLAAPVLLYLGMESGGLLGIVGAQALVMICTSLALMILVNRVSGARLPYFVSLGELADFYRDAWSKARRILAARSLDASVSPRRPGGD
jgi:O-antigen/teichoic acid export membrane protein